MKFVDDITRKMRTSMNTLDGMVVIARETIARGGDPKETMTAVSACLDMIADESKRLVKNLDELNRIESAGEQDAVSERLVSGRYADRHFMIVDDVPSNAVVVAEMLSLCGGIAVTAMNGQGAVNTFSKSDPGDFDCILMDLRMPVMDGFAAAEAIRAMDRPDAKTIPIVAMSADTFAEDRERAAAVGMNACLTKPVRFQELSAILDKYLKIG